MITKSPIFSTTNLTTFWLMALLSTTQAYSCDTKGLEAVLVASPVAVPVAATAVSSVGAGDAVREITQLRGEVSAAVREIASLRAELAATRVFAERAEWIAVMLREQHFKDVARINREIFNAKSDIGRIVESLRLHFHVPYKR